MKGILGQSQFETSDDQSRSPLSVMVSAKIAAVLSMGLTAASLSVAAPAFGQTAANTVNFNEKQNLACVTEGQRLVCDVPSLGQTAKSVTFEQKSNQQKSNLGEVSKTLELTPVMRTALLNPELDSLLSSSLLWISYLSLPLIVIGVIWRYDRRAREQMAILLQQMATLERIFQHPQVR